MIFERFNGDDARFTNDEVLEALIGAGLAAEGTTVVDMESDFEQICSCGLARNIAQNLTTMWFKLSEPLSAVQCAACRQQVHVSGSEKSCPDPGCGAALG